MAISQRRPAAAPLGRRRGTAGNVGDRGQLQEIQRARIVTAMCELAYQSDGGVAGITVSDVVGRSAISRRTFYELFEDREDCQLAAFDHAVERASAAVLPAYRAAAGEQWQERARAAVGALLVFLDGEPVLARMCVVGALAAGPTVLERRARVVEQLVDFVHRGAQADRAAGGLGARRSRVAAEGVVGAVLAVLHARLCAREPKPLVSLLNELMAIVLVPYLGPGEAERELTRRLPRRGPRRPPSRNPLRELDMRLTYRTVRVLGAIAEHPASNGRQIAQVAGVHDAGQISRLLSRLEHHGLVVNEAPGRNRGEPNAWTLTSKGHALEQVTRTSRAPLTAQPTSISKAPPARSRRR